jgi:hypothetical protein
MIVVRPFRSRRLQRIAAAAFAIVCLAACGSAALTSTEQDMVGTCLRSATAFQGPLIGCASDAACPCGSFCHRGEHVCKDDCWFPPINGCTPRRGLLSRPDLRVEP